jgi:hypothetical protein
MLVAPTPHGLENEDSPYASSGVARMDWRESRYRNDSALGMGGASRHRVSYRSRRPLAYVMGVGFILSIVLHDLFSDWLLLGSSIARSAMMRILSLNQISLFVGFRNATTNHELRRMAST